MTTLSAIWLQYLLTCLLILTVYLFHKIPWGKKISKIKVSLNEKYPTLLHQKNKQKTFYRKTSAIIRLCRCRCEWMKIAVNFVSKILIGRYYKFVVASTILTVSFSQCYLYCYYYRTWSNALLKTHTGIPSHNTEEHRCGIFFCSSFVFVPFFPLFFIPFRFWWETDDHNKHWFNVKTKIKTETKACIAVCAERNGNYGDRKVCKWRSKTTLNIER